MFSLFCFVLDQLFVSTVHNFMTLFWEIWIVSFSLVSMTTRRSAMVKQARSEPWTMSSTRGCASLISRERNCRGPLPRTVRRGERKNCFSIPYGQVLRVRSTLRNFRL
jgi:hypothetical protein